MKTFLKTTGWLVMAAALSFGTAACSSDDDVVKQPQNPTEPQVYTMVIQASKGGDDTRALRPADASGIDAYWNGYETFDVAIYDPDINHLKKIGTGTAAASETVLTTITATLSEAPTDEVYFYLHGSLQDYTGQNGLLTGSGSISEKYDYNRATLLANAYTVNGNNEIIPNDGVTLTFYNLSAIVKFTLLDKETSQAINPTSLTIHDYSNWLIQSWDAINYPENPVHGDITITPSGSTNEIYIALAGVGDSKLRLTATVGDDTYIYKKTDVTFEGGFYYTRTVKMTKCQAPDPSLSTLTIGSATIYYNSGETWAQAIANHPSANYDWYLSKEYGTSNYRVYWNSSYLYSKPSYAKVYSTSVINPEVSYSFSE